jgi:multimeric flavodoxin WrbA
MKIVLVGNVGLKEWFVPEYKYTTFGWLPYEDRMKYVLIGSNKEDIFEIGKVMEADIIVYSGVIELYQIQAYMKNGFTHRDSGPAWIYKDNEDQNRYAKNGLFVYQEGDDQSAEKWAKAIWDKYVEKGE